MVVDTEDYARVEKDSDYSDFLFHIFSSQRCLLVGFSFQDPALDRIFQFLQDRLGPTYPQLHLALIPAGNDPLASRLAEFNIECLQYQSRDGSHEELWAGVSLAARDASSSQLQPSYTEFPAALEGARRLIVSAYVHLKMRREMAPLRSHIVQGILVSLISANPAGMTRDDVVAQLQPLLPLDVAETERLVDQSLGELVRQGICTEDVPVFRCDLDESTAIEDMETLIEGVINRLAVREGVRLPPEGVASIRAILEDVILMRGWDLGADFAGTTVPKSLAFWEVLGQSAQNRAPGWTSSVREHVVAAAYDMLTRPTESEARILADLGRLSYGVDVVLQHGRSSLLHPATLPEKLYLDASFVMPAIVNGHPYRPAYLEALKRWAEATSTAGLTPRIIVAEEFLEEIVRHRELAVETVRIQELERGEMLKRHILLYGADNTNVFIGAYASWVGRLGAETRSFEDWLDEEAPYATIPELRNFLVNNQMEALNLGRSANEAQTELYHRMRAVLEAAYDADERRFKPDVLIKHEARQLARIKGDLDRGDRPVFVSADNRLRKAAIGPVLGEAGGAILSHLGLIQMIDFFVGMKSEPTSLARLLWGIGFLEEQDSARLTLRRYFTDRALQAYDSAFVLKLPEVLDKVVHEAAVAAREEGIRLDMQRDQAKTAKFIDRFEDGFFRHMNEAVEKLRRDEV